MSVEFRANLYLYGDWSVQTSILRQRKSNNLTPGVNKRSTTGLQRELGNGTKVVPSHKVTLHMRLFRHLRQVILSSVSKSIVLVYSL